MRILTIPVHYKNEELNTDEINKAIKIFGRTGVEDFRHEIDLMEQVLLKETIQLKINHRWALAAIYVMGLNAGKRAERQKLKKER